MVVIVLFCLHSNLFTCTAVTAEVTTVPGLGPRVRARVRVRVRVGVRVRVRGAKHPGSHN